MSKAGGDSAGMSGRGSKSVCRSTSGRGSTSSHRLPLGNGSTTDRSSMKKRFNEKVEEKLLAKLEETGFCREGYFEFGSSIGRGESFIRGECKEGATEEDCKKFILYTG